MVSDIELLKCQSINSRLYQFPGHPVKSSILTRCQCFPIEPNRNSTVIKLNNSPYVDMCKREHLMTSHVKQLLLAMAVA